ncbi:MAG: hypothetical protein KAW02_06960 [candidate division Zixibacteria bacterium]|nr:hypothetical protein [candidate division Zixibacteria bacterium]
MKKKKERIKRLSLALILSLFILFCLEIFDVTQVREELVWIKNYEQIRDNAIRYAWRGGWSEEQIMRALDRSKHNHYENWIIYLFLGFIAWIISYFMVAGMQSLDRKRRRFNKLMKLIPEERE